MLVVLVKPHPPLEILNKNCPVPENYKYAWEPVVLKLIVFVLNKIHPEVQTEIWHLIKKEDDDIFIGRMEKSKPDIVIFSEIDILVNEVNKIAERIKMIDEKTTTVVGGKQTSLLRKGDKFPFKCIDYAFRGDGPNSLLQFIEAQIYKKSIEVIEGFVNVDSHGYICGEDTFSPREYHDMIDNIEMHEIKVVNYDLSDYIENYQSQPSIIPDKVRTIPIYTGVGCPYNCMFCQSPFEYGKAGRVTLSLTDKVAAEIAWMKKKYKVNNFFSLEPNLNLGNLMKIYKSLEKIEINYVPISGFVRAGDIKKFDKLGILREVVEKGFRVVSIGLDIPLNTVDDVYNKSFSYNDMIECFDICEKYGIIALTTLFGDPQLTEEEFKSQLEFANKLPIAEVDVRLAIALRNTDYFKNSEEFLIYHPDKNMEYFDRQNYRYQTLQYPNKITPLTTYNLVNEFYDSFYFSETHLEYVKRMVVTHPDTINYFKRLYESKKKHKEYIKVEKMLVDLMNK